jgi:hypothetical protein
VVIHQPHAFAFASLISANQRLLAVPVQQCSHDAEPPNKFSDRSAAPRGLPPPPRPQMANSCSRKPLRQYATIEAGRSSQPRPLSFASPGRNTMRTRHTTSNQRTQLPHQQVPTAEKRDPVDQLPTTRPKPSAFSFPLSAFRHPPSPEPPTRKNAVLLTKTKRSPRPCSLDSADSQPMTVISPLCLPHFATYVSQRVVSPEVDRLDRSNGL